MSDLDVNKIICGDNIEIMKTWPADCIDTIITDPPYGLGFMGKDWDTFKPDEVARQKKRDTRTQKRRQLYNGRASDKPSAAMAAARYDFSRNIEFQQWFTIWAKEVLRIAKPGAIMMVFGGARTYHRLTCAIEDAGWQIRDCLMWLYGSGFPKSLNISKAIDKAKGEKRGRIKIPEAAKNSPDYHKFSGEIDDEIPITNLAKLWDGWGTALKPAYEPIIVAMKPLDGTFAANAEKHGVAGLNIGGGRIKFKSEADKKSAVLGSGTNILGGNYVGATHGTGETNILPDDKGRWPANVILDEESARLVNEQGGASRFFYCAKASKSERNAGCKRMVKKQKAGSYQFRVDGSLDGKLTAPKHNHHPTVKPLTLMEYLCKLTKTPTGGIVLDPFGGSGTTAIACINTERDYILIEKESEYIEIAERRTEYAAKKHKERKGLFA